MNKLKPPFLNAEPIVTVGLIIVLLLFLLPNKLLMPMDFFNMLSLLLVVAFLMFAGIIWKEKAADERENIHRLNAGRISFLAGTFILVVAILLQSIEHNVDPWLIYTLCVMIASKLIARIYFRITH